MTSCQDIVNLEGDNGQLAMLCHARLGLHHPYFDDHYQLPCHISELRSLNKMKLMMTHLMTTNQLTDHTDEVNTVGQFTLRAKQTRPSQDQAMNFRELLPVVRNGPPGATLPSSLSDE